ncbi:MAG: UDP-glucose/GDP-mannose dehydrogenase family protein [Phycisphaerales bacterium]|nr:UDP-glucose/GDP-mannose dehydrogenase family protein [Phycisphaerales bacterium]
MQIAVIGSGYVGLVTAACLADSGNHVVGVDNDAAKVAELQNGRSPFFEPGLGELVAKNVATQRLRFTTDLAAGVAGVRVVFLAVGTPPRPDGSADLSAIESVAVAVAKAVTGPAVIVTKSTVPVGTGARLDALIRTHTSFHCPVVSNPEFLKEGAALNDFLRPDRVVIGADDAEAAEVIAELHQPFVRNNKPVLRMSRIAAELTKYASNAYLATRISFINEIAEICEHLNVDINEVRRGMGSDARIGHHFLYPGVGYGGSCFPKDVQALAAFGRAAGADCQLLEAVHRRNLAQRERMIDRIRTRLGPDLRGKRFAVWGLAFKPQTDDLREAPALAIIDALLADGAQIAAHDPEALEPARKLYGDRITCYTDPYATLPGAEALLIMTEWMEFRSPDFARIAASLRQPLIFDGRNLFELDMMSRYNMEYHSVGRPTVRPK